VEVIGVEVVVVVIAVATIEAVDTEIVIADVRHHVDDVAEVARDHDHPNVNHAVARAHHHESINAQHRNHREGIRIHLEEVRVDRQVPCREVRQNLVQGHCRGTVDEAVAM